MWAESDDQTSDAQTEESQIVVVGCCCSLCNLMRYCVCVLSHQTVCVFLFIKQNPLSFKTSVAHKPQASSSVPSMHQAAASAHGFPLIKRKVRQKLCLLSCWSEWGFILTIRDLHFKLQTNSTRQRNKKNTLVQHFFCGFSKQTDQFLYSL